MDKYVLFLFSVCVYLLPNAAFATSYERDKSIKIVVSVPGGKLCNLGDQEIGFNLSIKNKDELGLKILDIRFTEEILINDISPTGTTIQHDKYYDGRLDIEYEYLESLMDLAGKESVTLPGLFIVPVDDGYYKETVKVFWEREGADKLSTTEHIFAFRIKKGCIKRISEKKYEKNTALFSTYSLVEDGETKTVVEMEGLTSPEDGEEIPDPSSIDIDFNADGEDFGVSPEERKGESFSRSVSIMTSTSEAPKYTYCVRMRFYDEYVDKPSSSGMKWWRPRGDGNKHNFLGLEMELWDRQSTTDRLIKKFSLNYSADGNYYCTGFEWDGAAMNDTYPDPYVRTKYKVKDTEHSGAGIRKAHLCTNNPDNNDNGRCEFVYVTTWRNYYTYNLGSNGVKSVYKDFVFGSKGSKANAWAMSMSALQKFFRSFQGYKMTRDIYVYWAPDGTAWPHNQGDQWITLMKKDDNGGNAYKRWSTPPHEAGHAYHKQLRGDYLYGTCPSPHYFDGMSNERCATTEGWAEFVAMKSWYDNPYANPRYGSNTNMENRTPYYGSHETHCYHNIAAKMTEGNVAKAFWDMYDRLTDTYTPVYDQSYDNVSWKKIVDVWTYFPDSSSNGGNQENVSNMRDYHHNSAALGSSDRSDIWDAMKQNRINCQSWCNNGYTYTMSCPESGPGLNYKCIKGVWSLIGGYCEASCSTTTCPPNGTLNCCSGYGCVNGICMAI